ncbi:MAG: hypothetical protein K2I53_09155, partial [Lachnospiraceae bacterium]|nr:hypothetical protein [Lachnospiraceae bacterium]
PGQAVKSHIFMVEDKLNEKIGMRVLRQGKESYYALLDAGENWYELHKSCEILLGKEKEVSFVVTPLTGKNAQTRTIPLAGARETGAPFTRFALDVAMASADTVTVSVTDLGFGEFFPAGGQKWEESFQIS